MPKLRISALLSLLLLVGCTHSGLKSNIPVPPHPCFTAAAKGNLEYFQQNLELCKTVKTKTGTTPLMLAAARGQNEVIQYLLKNGVDINEMDTDNGTPINYTLVGNRVSSAELLVLSGADLESKRPDGITVLMAAVQISSPKMVQALTTTGQAINAKAEDGWTALYFAIRRKDPSVLSLLFRSGACKNTIDSYKQTPLDFAKEVGWKEGVALIEKAPACGKK